jgi:hypothetical protein
MPNVPAISVDSLLHQTIVGSALPPLQVFGAASMYCLPAGLVRSLWNTIPHPGPVSPMLYVPLADPHDAVEAVGATGSRA